MPSITNSTSAEHEFTHILVDKLCAVLFCGASGAFIVSRQAGLAETLSGMGSTTNTVLLRNSHILFFLLRNIYLQSNTTQPSECTWHALVNCYPTRQDQPGLNWPGWALDSGGALCSVEDITWVNMTSTYCVTYIYIYMYIYIYVYIYVLTHTHCTSCMNT